MTLKEIKKLVQSVISITDADLLTAKINAAAREIWDTTDLPGSLEEDYFRLENTDPLVTLPYYVYAIRGVKPCCTDISTELNTPTAAYIDAYYTHSPWRWRVMKVTPLKEHIENASTLYITPLQPESKDVEIYISGKTDVADKENEVVLLKKGATGVFSTNRFEDLYLLEKSAKTSSNILVKDASGKEVAFIPNHILEARNILVQVLDACTNLAAYPTCVQVLYKKYLPPLLDDLDTFPEPFGHALALKVLEWFKIDSKDEVDHAGMFAVKSSSVIARASGNMTTGMTRPVRYSRGNSSAFYRSRRINL